MSRTQCQATQHSDQMFCERCALVWDMNDPDEPSCLTDAKLRQRRNDVALKQYGIKKGAYILARNGDVYKVSSFKARELAKPLVRGYRRLQDGSFSKRSQEVYGDWGLYPCRRFNGTNS